METDVKVLCSSKYLLSRPVKSMPLNLNLALVSGGSRKTDKTEENVNGETQAWGWGTWHNDGRILERRDMDEGS